MSNSDKPKAVEEQGVDYPTATVPDQEPEPQAPEEADSGEVLVRVVSPFYCTRFVSEDSEGGTLEVDRVGVAVPEQDVDDLIAKAAGSGVTLSRSE